GARRQLHLALGVEVPPRLDEDGVELARHLGLVRVGLLRQGREIVHGRVLQMPSGLAANLAQGGVSGMVFGPRHWEQLRRDGYAVVSGAVPASLLGAAQ